MVYAEDRLATYGEGLYEVGHVAGEVREVLPGPSHGGQDIDSGGWRQGA